MAKCTALKMDVVTKKSGHTMTGVAVSVCTTPAAPSPIPIPYPTVGNVSEGITDPCMRTKIGGAVVMTVGSCMSKCHGNEPGTLKEVVSLNTAGPCFPALGAPIVFMELGMAGITTSFGQMNKSITVGASGSASGAGGGGGGGGGAGGGGGGPGGGNTQGPGGGGSGGGGDADGAGPPQPPAPPNADGQATAGHPVDVITGALMVTEVDFQLPGFLWVSWRRMYTSSAATREAGCGHGWSHPFAWYGRLRGDRVELVDDQFRTTELIWPGEDEVVALDYGRRVSVEGAALVIDTGDGLFRVLRRHEGRIFRLVELRDEHGNAARLRWERERLVEIVDSVGRTARLHEEGSLLAWEAEVTDGQGQTHRRRLVSYELDARGDLVSVIDAGGAETRYAYDDHHYLTQEVRPDGLVYHFVHAEVRGERRCVETWGELPQGDILSELGADAANPADTRGVHHARLSYGPGRYDTRVVDALGQHHQYTGNRFGLVETYVDPLGHRTTLRYDQHGNPVHHTDGGGRTTTMGYDGQGLLATLRLWGQRLRYHYDEGQRLVGLSGVDGAKWSCRHDGQKVVAESDGYGGEIVYAYDERGRRLAVTRPDGSGQTMTYDAHGNIKSLRDATGAEWTYAFDLWGLPVEVTTPAGIRYRFEYDSRGDVARVEGSDGYRVEYEVDDLRRVTAVRHPGGEVTRTEYVADVPVVRHYPDGTAWRMAYDALLQLRDIVNPAGERWRGEYDGAGRLTAETNFSGLRFHHGYDGSGLRTTILQPDGTRTEIERNRGGLPSVIRRPGTPETRFQYDATGAILRAEQGSSDVEFAYTPQGQLLKEVQRLGAWRFEVDYEYDDRGGRVGQRYSSGWGLGFDYGPEGLLSKLRVRDLGGEDEETTAEIAFAHDANAREVRRSFHDLSVDTERGLDGRPTRVAVKKGDEVLRERRYRWDAKGPLGAVDDSRRGERRYELDEVGRPVSVQGLGSSERFSYSPHGTPVPEGGGWLVGANGRPLQTDQAGLRWDARGRLVKKQGPAPMDQWQFRYDDADRLVASERGDGRRVQYHYDAFNRRIASTADGETTFFGYDGDSIVEEVGPHGTGTRRVFARDEITPLLENAGGDPRLVLTDAASTPWLYLGKAGIDGEIDLSAWGETAHAEGFDGPLRFAGQRRDDDTGLHYHRHRYYDPGLHVFLTPDPTGFLGSFQEVGFVPNVTFYVDALGLWVAVIRGQDESPRTRRRGAGGAIDMATAQYAESTPGARVMTYNDLGPGSLNGATQVMVISHGAPGSISWGPHRPIRGSRSVNGEQLGDILNNAGFDGTAPGAQVDVLSCNAATPGLLGGNSVAQGVANRTLATTTGARADNRLLGALSMTGTTATLGSGTMLRDSPLAGRRFYTGSAPGPARERVTGGQMVSVSPRPANR